MAAQQKTNLEDIRGAASSGQHGNIYNNSYESSLWWKKYQTRSFVTGSKYTERKNGWNMRRKYHIVETGRMEGKVERDKRQKHSY
jgi:hypothetical protein